MSIGPISPYDAWKLASPDTSDCDYDCNECQERNNCDCSTYVTDAQYFRDRYKDPIEPHDEVEEW